MSEHQEVIGKYKPRPEDIKSPDAIIGTMYALISGPAGKRNWARFRSLFLEGARMVPIGKRVHREGDLEVLTVDEWVEEANEYLMENDFYEKEILRHADRFGDMIQAFSVYEARKREDAQPFARGINSIHLVFNRKRWWIVTVMWDNETRDNPIPGEFTPNLW